MYMQAMESGAYTPGRNIRSCLADNVWMEDVNYYHHHHDNNNNNNNSIGIHYMSAHAALRDE